MSNSSSCSTDRRAIAGGTIGGVIVLLVIITVVLCIVILCLKRSYRNATSSVDNQVSYSGTNVNTDVTIEHNPSYDVIKMDNSTVKSGDFNVSVNANPSCSTPTKPYSEDEYNFTQYVHHSDLREMIKMDINLTMLHFYKMALVLPVRSWQ